MRACAFLRLTLAALIVAAMTVLSASAQIIPQSIDAEDDTWTTGNNTHVDFSNFGNLDLGTLLGSPPVSPVVTFRGVPLTSAIGQADTLLARGPVTVGDKFSATLSLKGLGLTSSPDLVLQDGRVYHITVTLATQDGGGQLDFVSTSEEGGTYTSSFVVTPIFTLTNVNDPSESPHIINCLTDTDKNCSFPMHGGGDWLLTSSSGFDPQSQSIPPVPAGVQIGRYTTKGRKRFGGIQVGCGGRKSTGYSCGKQNQQDELHGFMGQASGHDVSPPNDCCQDPPPPMPTPTPTPTPTPPPPMPTPTPTPTPTPPPPMPTPTPTPTPTPPPPMPTPTPTPSPTSLPTQTPSASLPSGWDRHATGAVLRQDGWIRLVLWPTKLILAPDPGSLAQTFPTRSVEEVGTAPFAGTHSSTSPRLHDRRMDNG